MKIKSNKFGAKRTSCGLHEHASKKEAKVCSDLTLMAKGGVIHDLKYWPKYELFAYGPDGQQVPVCLYEADFSYRDLDALVVLDAKGFKTPVYRLKKRWMKACHGIEVQEC